MTHDEKKNLNDIAIWFTAWLLKLKAVNHQINITIDHKICIIA